MSLPVHGITGTQLTHCNNSDYESRGEKSKVLEEEKKWGRGIETTNQKNFEGCSGRRRKNRNAGHSLCPKLDPVPCMNRLQKKLPWLVGLGKNMTRCEITKVRIGVGTKLVIPARSGQSIPVEWIGVITWWVGVRVLVEFGRDITKRRRAGWDFNHFRVILFHDVIYSMTDLLTIP